MDKSQLFEKITLNNGTVVPNHLAIAPLTLFSSNPDGTINDEEREYLKLRATNIGLYILGAQVVSKEGITAINFPGTFCDKDLPSIKERADIVKSQGALAINQIHHGGALALKQYSGMTPVVPSKDIAVEEAKKRGADTDMHELTDNEINEIIEKFANATELSIKAGYNGVEIHGANNFLIQQFYSPHTNKRKDNWGGSDEKRMNFALKIVDAVCKIREKHKRIPKMEVNKKMKVLFISSKGGHFSELMQLKPVMEKVNYKIVTESTKKSNKNLREKFGKRISIIPYGTKKTPIRYIFILLANCFASLWIYIKFRPHVIVTTGTHTAGPMCCIGRILGSKVIFIESFANRNTKSEAGKLVYYVAHTFVVQWDEMEEIYPKAKNWGWIY